MEPQPSYSGLFGFGRSTLIERFHSLWRRLPSRLPSRVGACTKVEHVQPFGMFRLTSGAGGRGRPGPAQREPVNRVRVGRQQLSAGNLLCRSKSGRPRRPAPFSFLVRSGSQVVHLASAPGFTCAPSQEMCAQPTCGCTFCVWVHT